MDRRPEVANLRYIDGGQVKAGNIALHRMPLATEEHGAPIGEVDGLLIDLDARSVRYLVVDAAQTGQKHLLPLDATSFDPRSHVLERVTFDDVTSYPVFDPSSVDHYDDEALMSLLFDSAA